MTFNVTFNDFEIMGYFIILERLDSKQKSLFINMKIQI